MNLRMFLKMVLIVWVMLLKHNAVAVDNVITIDQNGSDTPQCCVGGKCPCSNLSQALTQIQDNTEIIITSDISLHDAVEFGNVSSIMITGHNNPTIMCDHQGGIVGKDIKQITIQNITWDKCNGIIMCGFTDTYITNCTFQHSNNFALTLDGFGSIHINGTSFSYNKGGVNALAPSVIVYNSNFARNVELQAFYVNPTTKVSITINGCSFTNNFGYGVSIIGKSFATNLLISSCSFTSNANSSIVGDRTNITLLDNITFCSNIVVGTHGYPSLDGAAIRVYNSTVNVNGTVMFCNNKVGGNGGAVYLLYSNILVQRGIVTFYNNTANNGGAVYIGEGSGLNSTKKLSLKFLNNTAISLGGTIYVDLLDSSLLENSRLVFYYSELSENNSVNNYGGMKLNNVYFNTNDQQHTFSKAMISSQWKLHVLDAKFYVNSSDLEDYNYYSIKVAGQLHNLLLNLTITDQYGNLVGPVNCSFGCEDNNNNYDCIIDSIHHNFTITTKDSSLHCSLVDDFNDLTNNVTFSFVVYDHNGIVVPLGYISVVVWWNRYLGTCNDIAHVPSYSHGCLPLSCDFLKRLNMLPQGIICNFAYVFGTSVPYSYSPGFWFDNGFQRFVIHCCIGYCKHPGFLNDFIYNGVHFPDSNSQCVKNWTGLACGECNDTAHYVIRHDSTDCIHLDQCYMKSVTLNLFVFFGVSFFYWCLVISFIFVLLHFQFDVTAGYAYGVIFYYSIIDQLFRMFSEYVHTDYNDGSYLNLVSQVVPFFSIVGNLKPPFLRYINLCFSGSDMIDHVFLDYIHPIIVTCLVILIFVTARRFVVVARFIGRFVNSRSICLLLLLSYSSVCYTSVRLLKPIIVYSNNGYEWKWHTYLSPVLPYFYGRHILYGIIAILCELIIGIGLPLVILTQRYLIRYFNLKLISIKPVIDQLQGCYKEDYHWFAAYYLICRQVIYASDLITSFFPAAKFSSSIHSSVFVLLVCVFILIIHLWFQPSKKISLNILDAIILSILLLTVSSGFFMDGLEYGDVFCFIVSPLLCVVNFLTLYSKLKHILIPCSCIGMLILTSIFGFGAFRYPFMLVFTIIFITYVVTTLKYFVLKLVYKKRNQVDYVLINNEDIDDGSEDSMRNAEMP